MKIVQFWSENREIPILEKECMSSITKHYSDVSDIIELKTITIPNNESISLKNFIKLSIDISNCNRLSEAKITPDLFYCDTDVLMCARYIPPNDGYAYFGVDKSASSDGIYYNHHAFFVNGQCDLFTSIEEIWNREYNMGWCCINKIINRNSEIRKRIKPIPFDVYYHLNLSSNEVYVENNRFVRSN